jgi:ureidoglycolate lyase
MKLARFDAGQGAEIGRVDGDAIIPVTRDHSAIGDDMTAVIAAWSDLKPVFAGASGDALSLNTVRLLPPIARPGKIFAIGLNYADHIAESGMATPERQIWFTKAVTSITGPHDAIDLPMVPEPHVDYEVELVAVIGAGGKRITRDAAPGAVFGWCVGNDVTERAWQHAGPQWSLGKSFDTHGPIGPWITTADDVPDAHALDIRCLVNGDVRQSSNTRHLHFDVWAQIEHLSQAMTLEPGDLLFTGTPGGVGAAMKPMQFLKDGDVVRCEAGSLGAIENVCRTGVA